jgi:hypothetical protein
LTKTAVATVINIIFPESQFWFADAYISIHDGLTPFPELAVAFRTGDFNFSSAFWNTDFLLAIGAGENFMGFISGFSGKNPGKPPFYLLKHAYKFTILFHSFGDVSGKNPEVLINEYSKGQIV